MELIQVKILNTTIERAINKELSMYQITSAQSDILIYLHRHPTRVICQKDLETALSLTHPTVSSILKRLDEKQLITSASLADDHRFKQIKLTAKSESIIAQLNKKVEEIYMRAIAGFRTDEIDAFSALLRKMTDNLK